MRTANRLSHLALLASFALSVACGGAAQDEASSAAGGGESEAALSVAGHGNASMPDQDLMNGDRSNPFDSTDDPSDPEFVPAPSPKLAAAAAQDGTASTSEALSTTYGTTFDLTYYVVSLRPTPDAGDVTLRDCAGNFLTTASRAWRDDAWMQGTARFLSSDGTTKTINIGSGCWITLPYAQRWGLGVTNPATGNSFNLRPFRSIAVDRSILTVGKWYYVKQLDGARMPYPASTMVHDGCVRAVDVGPAILGRHIDFFVGYYSAYRDLITGSTTMGGRETVTIYSGTDRCADHISRGY